MHAHEIVIFIMTEKTRSICIRFFPKTWRKMQRDIFSFTSCKKCVWSIVLAVHKFMIDSNVLKMALNIMKVMNCVRGLINENDVPKMKIILSCDYVAVFENS